MASRGTCMEHVPDRFGALDVAAYDEAVRQLAAGVGVEVMVGGAGGAVSGPRRPCYALMARVATVATSGLTTDAGTGAPTFWA
jgi:hypothetical protein